MNIAHILSSSARLPLSTHHGRYDWVIRLARAQADKNHKVTIYAAPGSSIDIPEIKLKHSLYDFGNKAQNDIATIRTAFSGNHDIYHSHLDYSHYFVADTTPKPVVFTQHWFPNEKIANAVSFNKSMNVTAIPITRTMQQENLRLGIPGADYIYHGIDLEFFSPKNIERSNRFIFVGRIAPHKGVDKAIMLAKATNTPLDIVGKLNEEDDAYWNTIANLIDGKQIRYLGPQPASNVVNLLRQARAFLFPSPHPESFGQVTIEAQACGTPVIISDVGASSELVQHGVTGFIAHDDSDYFDAIRKIDTINPKACTDFAHRFDFGTMLDRYNAQYQDVLQGR